jgi:hypothetical protein
MSSSHKQKDYSEWVWGKQAVLDLIKIHPQNVERVLISAPDQDRQRQEIADLCARAGIPVSIKEGKEISRILPVPAHQNAAARLKANTPTGPPGCGSCPGSPEFRGHDPDRSWCRCSGGYPAQGPVLPSDRFGPQGRSRGLGIYATGSGHQSGQDPGGLEGKRLLGPQPGGRFSGFHL